ncbi:hypothetical protein SKAU_G00149360 [Synaphobranchus kaupii]|uniref:Uncharacterized protein n=1 Tax=Synaphobranchus kaupii TaxID=118154 RepID=A0A9Q1FUV4_SYNKA|nr:hypothetical protein SKAU_G00149360 [Synaphobranchus kaupii]
MVNPNCRRVAVACVTPRRPLVPARGAGPCQNRDGARGSSRALRKHGGTPRRFAAGRRGGGAGRLTYFPRVNKAAKRSPGERLAAYLGNRGEPTWFRMKTALISRPLMQAAGSAPFSGSLGRSAFHRL